jgi:hypothetical protein
MKAHGGMDDSNMAIGLPLSHSKRQAEFVLVDIAAVYTSDAPTGLVEFSCFPLSMRKRRVAKRQFLDTSEVRQLPAQWQPMPARQPESLVQLHVRGVSGPAAFAQGRTLRNGEATQMLKFESQRIAEEADSLVITTTVPTSEGRQATSRKRTISNVFIFGHI